MLARQEHSRQVHVDAPLPGLEIEDSVATVSRPKSMIPALAITVSSPPKRPSASLDSVLYLSLIGYVCTQRASALPPVAMMALATSCAASRLTSSTAMLLAPSSASLIACSPADTGSAACNDYPLALQSLTHNHTSHFLELERFVFRGAVLVGAPLMPSHTRSASAR